MIALACSGCRLGFHEADLVTRDAAVDGAADAAVDAPSDARIVAHTFGERPTSMHSGVTIDATLAQGTPSVALGLDQQMGFAGVDGDIERAALRFDVSALAAGTLVVAARLELVRLDLGDEFAAPIGLRTVGESWVETVATWNEHDTGLTWTTPGGDPSPTLHAMLGPLSTDAFAFPLPVGVVQAWVDTPATNLGLLVVMADESVDGHYHVHSRESQILDARPQLVVEIAE